MATQLQDMKADQAANQNDLARRAAHPITGKTDYLDKRKDLLGTGIPGHMTVEREIRTATVMLMQSNDLKAAKPESFYVAVSIAINSGIGLGNGKGYLVAYKGNVSYVPGWKGLIDLVNRTGRASAWTGVVHKGDHFEYALGDSPFLTHKPGDNEEHNDITHYYAIGRVKGAEYPHIVVWSVNKVIKHLTTYNKVGGKHYALKNDDNMDAYGRKVVLLQVIKYLPTSVELENAINAENASAAGRSAKVENTIDGNFVFIDDDDHTTAEDAITATDDPVPDAKPAAADQRRANAEDVEVREAAKPAAAAAVDKPAMEKLTPEISEAYERTAGMLQRADTLNRLADAQEMIAEVGNKELRDQLKVIYKQRLAEMSDKPTTAAAAPEEKAAPAKRVRRSAPAPE